MPRPSRDETRSSRTNRISHRSRRLAFSLASLRGFVSPGNVCGIGIGAADSSGFLIGLSVMARWFEAACSDTMGRPDRRSHPD